MENKCEVTQSTIRSMEVYIRIFNVFSAWQESVGN